MNGTRFGFRDKHSHRTFCRTWSTDGCFVSALNDSHVTCSCNHMTSFAVMMQVVNVSKFLIQHLDINTNSGLTALPVSGYGIMALGHYQKGTV